MNVQVKHEGTAITGYVISYEREHKICTGIGNLTVTVDRTIPRTFNTWDTIDIWENGSFKVRYYVSSVTDIEPKGEIVLDCQDISKRLVDYFIPDSYTIDYPSYTRYWIERFLTEAGLDYQFTTTSQGTLLSNFTQLGLVTAYEQLLTLLQMSGWFMYFSGDEKAVIGSLDIDLALPAGSVGKTDVLTILKTSNDKMLRNRALVLGAFDPYTNQYASAEVSVHTPWNYDHRDLRTVVISNSNIPNKGTAYGMANQIIKEFSKITVEKHLTLWGARNYTLGRALRVNTNIWRGRGLITTFGVSMGKDGLITNVVLDERCPRLFGYFDYGDYVYVGTYGDGIWRKHLKFDNAWYDFSDGLTDLQITDLHINNDVFGSVAAAGEMYLCYGNDSTWRRVSVSGGLESSRDNTITGSGAAVMETFSGIMARATIVDRESNIVKFGVDNYSGLNMGDYFLSSGWLFPTTSGISFSGIRNRGWILEYNAVTGQLLSSGVHQISISGNYNIQVIDLENDGLNDFVSVKISAPSTISGYPTSMEWDYGYGNPYELPRTGMVSWSTLNGTSPSSLGVVSQNALHSWGAVDNYSDHEFFWTDDTHFKINKYQNNGTGISLISSASISLPGGITPFGQNSQPTGAILRPTSGVYKFLAQGDGVTYDRYVIVTMTNTGGTSYTTTIDSVLSDSRVNAMHQNGNLVAITRTDETPPPDVEIQAGVIDILTGGYTLTSVYSSGGTATDRKEPYAHFYVLNGILCGVGYVVEWNIFDATNKEMFVLSMNGGAGLIKGDSLTTADISIPISLSSTQISRIYAHATTSVGATTYAVYNSGAHTTLSEATGKLHPILDSTYDTTAVRINNTTKLLQTSTIPISTWTSINFGDDVPVTGPFSYVDTITGDVYLRTKSTATSFDYIVGLAGLSSISTRFRMFTDNSPSAPNSFSMYNVGNFIVARENDITNPIDAYLLVNRNPAIGGLGNSYLVLRREEESYTIIEQELYPIRVDISNNAPLLTVGSGEQSFKSNYVYENELDVVSPTSLTQRQVNDYRYTYLEPTANGLVSSGLPLSVTGLYVYGSGVFGADVLTYSGGFSLIYGVPSGNGTRIETSNYGVGGQYVFITASGFVQTFYQKNPDEVAFFPYSGLPQSRATIIRLDDVI